MTWVPLDEADPFADPHAQDAFGRVEELAEAAALLAAARRQLSAQQWADLAGTLLAGVTYREYAVVIGRSEARVQQRVSAALAAARGEAR